MDLGICGIIDIIIVVGVLLFAIIGNNKGFSKKLLSPITILIFIGVSVVLCSSLATILTDNHVISDSINNTLVEQAVANNATGETYSAILKSGFGIIEMFGGMIEKMMTNNTNYGDIALVADPVLACCDYLTMMIMNCICFVIVFVVLVVAAAILRAIGQMKGVFFIRMVDSILGIIFYVTLFSVFVCVVFCLLKFGMEEPWFEGVKNWLTIDMQLDTDKFRISKLIYESNVLQRLIDLIRF